MKTLEKKTTRKFDYQRVFKNYDLSCPRCQELSQGASPRAGWSDWKREQERRQIEAIRNHDCKKSNCMAVCTFGDW